MMEITDERREGFEFGVLYERTRILENLRLMLLPAMSELERRMADGTVPENAQPAIGLEDLIDWALSIVENPIHTMEEANHQAAESLRMINQQLAAHGIDVEEAVREFLLRNNEEKEDEDA